MPRNRCCVWVATLAALATCSATAGAQQLTPPGLLPATPSTQRVLARGAAVPGDRLQRPVYRVAEAPSTPPALANRRPVLEHSDPNEHPLMPALRWAHEGVLGARAISDYQAVFVKRERVNGELLDHEFMLIKVRHQPLSVYMHFLNPPDKRGQEVIWIEGQNDGKMWGHTTGLQHKVVGAVQLAPTGMIAMRGNRHPITEAGVLNLLERLIQIGEADTKYGECEVKFYQGAKVDERQCTCIQVMHPTPRRNFLFHLARIYVDDELNLPIRYEAYDWPAKAGGPPQLTEEYTYTKLKLNNGYTDIDFDPNNPAYRFNR